MQPSGSSRRLRQRINLLWVLAALLGTAAIHGTARAIHHPEPSAEIMGHFAEVMAGFATSIAEGRLQALARESFAPVTPWSPGPLAPRAVVDALVRGALEAERCHCRPSVPTVEFFHFDRVTGAVDLRTAPAPERAVSLPDSLLRSSALAPRPRDESLALRFVSDGRGAQYAILTSVQHDSRGAPTGGYGMVTSAPALVGQLFGGDASPGGRSSLEVSAASGPPLFRTTGPEEPYHATIRPQGLLAELAVTAGLAPPTGLLSSFQTISRDQLWFSGLLLAATVLVIVIAAASSRREALLARARSDFIAGVSHELRMPLAQILLASETLAQEREPDSAARLGLATSIVREARRLATLVDNVLLVARSGAVALRPTLTAVDLEGLFAEVGESVELAVEEAGQRLEVRPSNGLVVLGDRQLLRQALTNLIDNARKYGGPSQTIRLGAEEGVNDWVHLYVENDGPSIPHALRAKLFEPYERLPRDQTSERTGSGLGLAVVAQIARACGGSVSLRDGRPGGTRAVLELRAAVPAQAT
jgi:signal transduction histidine kinase